VDPTAGLDVVAKRFSLQSVLQAIASHVTHSNTLGYLSNSNIIMMIMTLTIRMMIIIIIPL
jgi:hypothetical protein